MPKGILTRLRAEGYDIVDYVGGIWWSLTLAALLIQRSKNRWMRLAKRCVKTAK